MRTGTRSIGTESELGRMRDRAVLIHRALDALRELERRPRRRGASVATPARARMQADAARGGMSAAAGG